MENPLISVDAYKLSHKQFMPDGVEVIYSNFTARSNKHSPIEGVEQVVFFGLQYFIKDYLIEQWNNGFFNRPKEEVIGEFKRFTDNYLGKDAISMKHFEELHDLGYLPVEIKAVPEGDKVEIKVPFLTIKNTDNRFAWLTNYLETVLSCELWKPITVATIINAYRDMVEDFNYNTTGSFDDGNFQLHGFEFRGMSNRKDAALCAAAFLLNSYGTDTFPALPFIEKYYGGNSDKELIMKSVPATEHSLASLGISLDGELETIKRWITKDYPSGIVSVISDTFDFFKVITDYATELKNDILNRQEDENGMCRTVFRGDSGYPPDIIAGKHETFASVYDFLEYYSNIEYDFDVISNAVCYCLEDNKYYCLKHKKGKVIGFAEYEPTPEEKGAIECLWDIFGGEINDCGYKVLNSKVGFIYGDSMTPEITREAMERLMEKGFATTNLIVGVGSYTCQYLTRDTFGMAIKATAAKVNGEWKSLFKNPKTDDGVKKSAKGLFYHDIDSDYWFFKENVSEEDEKNSRLPIVFKDGKLLIEYTFSDIRENLGFVK